MLYCLLWLSTPITPKNCENLASSVLQHLRSSVSCSWCLQQTGQEASGALKVSHRPVQRFQQLQNLTILIVKSCSILSKPRLLQVLSGKPENALAESESTLHSSREAWEHLEVLKTTGGAYRSVWVNCVWLPDQFTFCWCKLQCLNYGVKDEYS